MYSISRLTAFFGALMLAYGCANSLNMVMTGESFEDRPLDSDSIDEEIEIAKHTEKFREAIEAHRVPQFDHLQLLLDQHTARVFRAGREFERRLNPLPAEPESGSEI